jgi:hypothetical protein
MAKAIVQSWELLPALLLGGFREASPGSTMLRGLQRVRSMVLPEQVDRRSVIGHARTVKQGRVFVAALGRNPETVPLHAT